MLLRVLSRRLEPGRGTVTLGGSDITAYGTKELARGLASRPQRSTPPGDIVGEDLVARRRYPHQGLFKWWSAPDREAVDKAMAHTTITDLAQRRVALSGGQQQVWLARCRPRTPPVLLDEASAFLD